MENNTPSPEIEDELKDLIEYTTNDSDIPTTAIRALYFDIQNYVTRSNRKAVIAELKRLYDVFEHGMGNELFSDRISQLEAEDTQ